MMRPRLAARMAGAASLMRRGVLAVAAVSAVSVASPAAALPVSAQPPAAAQRPPDSTRDTSARPPQDTASTVARDSGAAANAVSATPGSGSTAPATATQPAAAAQPPASGRAADSLRAAAARHRLLGDLSLVQAIVAVLLASLAFFLGFEALQLFQRYGAMVGRDESIGVTSHWGGFGGGASGWRASPALALLVGAIILLGGATTVALSVVSGVLDASSNTPPAAPRPQQRAVPPAPASPDSTPGN